MRKALEKYFERILTEETNVLSDRQGRLGWRLSCFDSGEEYARYIENHHFPLKGKSVFDVACAWGGHAIALAQRAGSVIGSDLNDHQFPALAQFSREQSLPVSLLRSDVERIPLADASFDVILALELVEHIGSVQSFASEVRRILKPGGICIISTPARLRSFFWGEPHYLIKGLTIFPFSWQKAIATKIFGRTYPYPITRQYLTAAQVIRPFADQGLKGSPVLRGRMAELFKNSRGLSGLAESFFWSFVIVSKPVKV